MMRIGQKATPRTQRHGMDHGRGAPSDTRRSDGLRGRRAERRGARGWLAAGLVVLVALLALVPQAPGTAAVTSAHAATAAMAARVGVAPRVAAPAVTLNPTSLTFGDQPVSTVSATQTVALTNTGTAPLTVTNVSLIGADTTDFLLTSTCLASGVAPNAACAISVRFAPTATGTRSASVSITDNAANSPQTLPLTGTGGAPGVSLVPTSLTFANQTVSTQSATQPVTLINNGTAPLVVGAITLGGANSGDFSETDTCAGITLAANGACLINVRFKPTATGARSATLSIADNAAGSPQSLPLAGTGVSPAVTLSAGSLTFSSQPINTTSPGQSIVVTNTGSSPLTISSLGLSGANPSDFALSGSCGNATVAPAATCAITVTVTPLATGSRSATLSINDNAANSPQTVALTGNGINPLVGLLPTSLSFANQTVGTSSAGQSIYVANFGSTPLTITAITITGTNAADFSQTNTCAGTVAPSSNCVVTVTFAPTAAGARSATLSIADNAANSPQSVPLTGGGVAAPTSTPTTAPTPRPTFTPTPGHTKGLPLTVSLSRGPLITGRTLTIGVKTAAHQPISIVLQAVTTRKATKGPHKGHKVSVTLYHVKLSGRADGKGRYTGHIRVTYRPATPVQATLSVTAGSGRHAATRKATLTIQAIPVSLRVTPSQVSSGGVLTVTVQTAARARVSVLLRVLLQEVTFNESHGKKSKSVHVYVLYQTGVQGLADARGRYRGQIRVTYSLSDPVNAVLTATARSSAGAATATAQAGILPTGS